MTLLQFFERMLAALQDTVAGATVLTETALPFLLAVILFILSLVPVAG